MKAFVLLVVAFLPSCTAFPTHAPISVCEEFLPHHGRPQIPAKPLNSTPYTITVTPGNYTPGSQLTVTIAGSELFKGFMMQVRREGVSGPPYPIGTFKSPLPPKTTAMWCSGGEPMNTVSHLHPSKVNFTSAVAFKWMAPAEPAGNISFYLTIVKQYDTFWVKQKSAIITGPPANSTAKPVLEENFEISKSGCGETKGCYSEPSSCTNSEDCTFLMTYKDNGDNITFELSTSLGYASVGFNPKQEMNNTDSIFCMRMPTSVVKVRQYFLDYHQPIRYDLRSSKDIQYIQGVYNNGIVKCRFTRKKVPVAPKMLNLDAKNWYFIFAWSKVSPTGGSLYHYGNASFTPEVVDVTKPLILKNGRKKSTPTISPDEKITKTECGKTKSCYSDPSDCKTSDDCDYLLTYKADKTSATFEMSAKSGWVAVGFNNKGVMDGTDTIICSSDGSSLKIENYDLKGYGYPIKDNQGTSRLKDVAGKYVNGVIHCKFTRQLQEPSMRDLTEKVFVIFARGQLISGSLDQHSHKSSTVKAVDIRSTETLKAGEKNFALIKAHAILMSIAWLFFASLAIFSARYMKPAWGELCGKKAWFQVHRFFMVLTLLFTVIGVILAFVYAEGWTQADDAHPIIGIIVLVLTVIQPVMAFFRPAPGDDSRFLFNVAHRSVGLSALVLAVVNCFLGVLLPHFDIQTIGFYPLIAYCVGIFLVLVFEIALMVLAIKSRSTDLDHSKAEMKDGKVEVEYKKPAEPANQNKFERNIMFALVFIVVSGSCLALIILLSGR